MKKLGLCLTAAVMALVMAAPVYAGTWSSFQRQNEYGYSDTVWNYTKDNGEKAASEWLQDGGNWYYFGADGIMYENELTPDGYAIGFSGVWVQSIPRLQLTEAMQKAYKRILSQPLQDDLSENPSSNRITSYAVFDLNYDGIPELLVYTGNCEAEFRYEVYTFTNGAAKWAGKYDAGHAASGILTDGNDNVYYAHAHMGDYWVAKYNFDGAAASETEVPEPAGIPRGEYGSMDYDAAEKAYEDQLGGYRYVVPEADPADFSLLSFN